MLRARLSRLVSAAAPLAFSLARGLLQLSVVRGMLAACLVYVLALRTVAAHLLAVPRGLSAALWRSLLTSQPSSAPSSRSSSPFPSSPNLFASAWRSSSSAAALAHLNRAAASSSLPAPSDFDAALLDPPAYQGKHGNGEELNDNESMSEASWFVEPAGPFSPLLIARTPEECFEATTKDFEYEPHYIDVFGCRVHYVDVSPPDLNPADLETVLCVHSGTTWSYLYRKMIPPFIRNDCRVVCLDLIGFGKSDKVTDPEMYTPSLHVATLRRVIMSLDPPPRNLTIVSLGPWASLFPLLLTAESPPACIRRLVFLSAPPPPWSSRTSFSASSLSFPQSSSDSLSSMFLPSSLVSSAMSIRTAGESTRPISYATLSRSLLHLVPTLAQRPSLFVRLLFPLLQDRAAAAYDAPYPVSSSSDLSSGLRASAMYRSVLPLSISRFIAGWRTARALSTLASDFFGVADLGTVCEEEAARAKEITNATKRTHWHGDVAVIVGEEDDLLPISSIKTWEKRRRESIAVLGAGIARDSQHHHHLGSTSSLNGSTSGLAGSTNGGSAGAPRRVAFREWKVNTVIVPEAGHYLPEERGEQTARLVMDFIQSSYEEMARRL